MDAKEFMKTKGAGPDGGPAPEADIAEVFSPSISTDHFVIGGRSFQVRVSNIRTQKVMAKSLDCVSDLLDKISFSKLMEAFQGVMGRDGATIDYVEMADMAQGMVTQIAKDGGLSAVIETIMDLYVGIVFAICHGQDPGVTREWVEGEIGFADAAEIAFIQLEKDRVGGRVIDFLSGLTRAVMTNRQASQSI